MLLRIGGATIAISTALRVADRRPRSQIKSEFENRDAIIAMVLGTPSERDLRRTVASYGAGRMYAGLLRLAGSGILGARQVARSAILLTCIVSDLGREVGLELEAYRSPWSHSVDARRRVSGAGMRTYLNVCAKLGIAGDDRIALLGSPPQFEFDEWRKAASDHAELTMPEGALLSISAKFGIYMALRSLYDDQDAATWAYRDKHNLPISCQPIEHMTQGLDELLEARRWLDGQIQSSFL